MAFTRFGGDNDQIVGGTTLNLQWPASVTADMCAVVTIAVYMDDTRTLTVAGFTQRALAEFSDDAGSGSYAAVFTRDCDGSETGDIAVAVNLGSNYAAIALDVYSGDGALTYNSVSTLNSGAAGNDATAPSVTGASTQGLVAAFFVDGTPGTINSGPSGMTAGSTNVADMGTALYDEDLSSSGATGTKTFDFTTNRNWGGYAILIDDAGGGGSPITDGPALVSVRSNIRFN